MRRFAGLGLALVLAACQMQAGGQAGGSAPDVAGIAEDAIEVSTLPSGGALPTAPSPGTPGVAPPTAAAAQPTIQTPDATTPRPPLRPEGISEPAPPPAAVISPEERLCTTAGGTWAKVGGAGRICVKPTRDGGKSCRKKSDCKSECLAQSGTCAPITPLMGCNDVLDNEGRRMTQCLQ